MIETEWPNCYVFIQMEFASHSDLLEENARLHGKVKSLEYEVEMLTQLVKNIIYGGTASASGPHNP